MKEVWDQGWERGARRFFRRGKEGEIWRYYGMRRFELGGLPQKPLGLRRVRGSLGPLLARSGR